MVSLNRPSPEIERRLKKVEEGVQKASSPIVNQGGSWVPTTEYLYLAYASALTNLGTDGTIPNQSDATDFQYTPFDPTGNILSYRGRYVSTSTYASGDPTDYIWEDTSGISGNSFVRYYTDNDELLVNLGDPDNPGSGITWTSIAPATAIPGTAFWVADQYTTEGIQSGWEIYPVQVSSAGGGAGSLGLITYTKAGSNKPVLNDATWQADVLLAATAFTGLTYSTHTELGFGATIVITYDDGKIVGTLREVATVATWVVPDNFLDGDLVVNGTITTSHIAANTIKASNIEAGTITGTEVTLSPGDVGAGTDGGTNARMNVTSGSIKIYDSTGQLRITLGDLS